MKDRDLFDQYLEKELGESLDFQLPEDFSEKVVHRVVERQEAEARVNYYLVAGAIGLFFILASVSMVIFMPKDTLGEWLPTLGWGVMIGLLITLFQYLDQKVIRKLVGMS